MITVSNKGKTAVEPALDKVISGWWTKTSTVYFIFTLSSTIIVKSHNKIKAMFVNGME
jgi:hypothetical protein